jgi:hypothetical protein
MSAAAAINSGSSVGVSDSSSSYFFTNFSISGPASASALFNCLL